MTGTDPSAGVRPHPRERARRLLGAHFDNLAAMLDATTFRQLDRLGIAAGWRCWEVGAGSASVPTWLAQRVGPEGRVLATDIEVTFLQPSGKEAFEVRRHDIGVDAPPAEAFDLVHARLLLEHITSRDVALDIMARALRPGGWLLIESADPRLQPLACPDEVGPAEALANRLLQAAWTLQARRTDLGYGRTLPRQLRSAGLIEVGAEVRLSLGGLAATRLQRTMIERAREPLVAASLATDEEIEQHLADIAGGQLDFATFPVVSAWGRKAR